MNKNDFDKIKEAVADVSKGEVKIDQGEWGVKWSEESKKWVFEAPYEKTCCPLGAVLLKHQPPVVESLFDPCVTTAAKFFDTTVEKVQSFTSGFDGEGFDETDEDKEVYEMGREIGLDLGLSYVDHVESEEDLVDYFDDYNTFHL